MPAPSVHPGITLHTPCARSRSRESLERARGLSPVEKVTPQMVGLVTGCIGAMLGGMLGGVVKTIRDNGY